MSLPRGFGVVPGVIGLLGVTGFLLANEAVVDFPLDDAWIHLAYARGLVRDGSFTYNPGEPEAGFTSPLWVLLTAPVVTLCDGLSMSPVLPVKSLSLLFGVLGVLALTRWVRALEGGFAAQGALWLLYSSAPGLVFASLSGMEVTLLLALMAFAVERTWRSPGFGAGILWALAGLARPEAAVPALVVFLGVFARHRPGTVLRTVLPPVLVVLTWAAWCLGVTGHPVPNTFAVKAFSGGGVGDSLAHLTRVAVLGEGITRVALVAPGVILGLIWLLARPEVRKTSAVFALAMLAALVSVLVIHPLSPSVKFFHTRYLIPFLVPFLAFGAVGVEALIERLRSPKSRLIGVSAGVVAVVLASFPGWWTQRASYHGHCREVHQVHTLPARFLIGLLPPGGLVAVEAAGSARFHLPSDRRVLDLLGLNDHRIAWTRQDQFARSCYILGRRPDFLLIPDFWQERLDPGFSQEEIWRWESEVWTSGDGSRTRRVLLVRSTPRPEAWAFCARRYGEEAR